MSRKRKQGTCLVERTAGGAYAFFNRLPQKQLDRFVGQSVSPRVTDRGVTTCYRRRRLVVRLSEIDLLPQEYPARLANDLVVPVGSFPDLEVNGHPYLSNLPVDPKQAVWVPPGLVDVFVKALVDEGFSVHVHDRVSAWPADARDGSLAAHVRNAPTTLVRHHGGSAASLVLELVSSFADRRSLVLASRKREVELLRGMGRTFLSNPERQVDDSDRSPAFTTYRGHRLLQDDRFDLIVFVDAVEASRDVGREMLTEIGRRNPHARLVAFVPTTRLLSAWECDLAVSLFGTKPVDLLPDGRLVPPVRVVYAPWSGTIRAMRSIPGDLPSLLQEGVFHEPQRNRAIADVAAGLIRGNAKMLAGRLIDMPDPRVVVLAATPGQAVSIRAAFAGGALPQSITVLTPDELQQTGVPDGILMRADAGVDLPPGLTPWIIASCRTPELLVIDLADRNHPMRRQRTRRRQRAYAEAYWAIGSDDAGGSTAFWHNRPCGR